MSEPESVPARLLAGRRLVIVLTSLRRGGAEWQAVQLGRWLTRRAAAEVAIVAFEPTGPLLETCRDAGLPVVAARPGVGPVGLRRMIELFRFVVLLRGLRPDLVLPFTDWPNKVCGAVWPLTGARGSVWNQREDGREVTGRPFEALALRWTSCFVANSRSGERFLCDRLGVDTRKVMMVSNGLVERQPRAEPSIWRQRLGCDDAIRLVVMVGNLHEGKDHATLLDAWRTVVQEAGPSVVLALAGRRDALADVLEHRARALGVAASVRFLGEVDDVAGLLRAADLAVHSTRSEGCSNALLEEMAAGLAVVASDISPCREVLRESPNLLVPAGDAAALAEGVLRLLADPDGRRRIGAGNRALVRARHDPDVVYSRYAGLLAEVLRGC